MNDAEEMPGGDADPVFGDRAAALVETLRAEPELAGHLVELEHLVRGMHLAEREFDLFACLAVDALGDHEAAQPILEAIERLRPLLVHDVGGDPSTPGRHRS